MNLIKVVLTKNKSYYNLKNYENLTFSQIRNIKTKAKNMTFQNSHILQP